MGYLRHLFFPAGGALIVMVPIIIPQRVTTLTGEAILEEIIIIIARHHGLGRHRDHTEGKKGKAGMDWLVPVHLFLDKTKRKHDNRVFSGRGAAWKRT